MTFYIYSLFLISMVFCFFPVFSQEEDVTIYRIVDEMPAYPGCENTTHVERNICNTEKVSEYLDIIDIPYGVAIANTAYVSFIVFNSGITDSIAVLRSTGDKDLDDLLVRHLENMPRWTAGKQNGKSVNVQYTVPVRFEYSN